VTPSNLPSNFAASLSYMPTDVVLNLTAALGTGLGLSQNQQNVADAINNLFNTGGALPPAFLTLFGLTGANLGNALTLLSGEPVLNEILNLCALRALLTYAVTPSFLMAGTGYVCSGLVGEVNCSFFPCGTSGREPLALDGQRLAEGSLGFGFGSQDRPWE
jgi:hypothetical protein